MQADSCLNSKQIDTIFISVGGQEGGFGGGGGVILGRRPKKWHDCQENICLHPPGTSKELAQPLDWHNHL